MGKWRKRNERGGGRRETHREKGRRKDDDEVYDGEPLFVFYIVLLQISK